MPGDAIGLKDALDTIQSHLECCDELVKRNQEVPMNTVASNGVLVKQLALSWHCVLVSQKGVS